MKLDWYQATFFILSSGAMLYMLISMWQNDRRCEKERDVSKAREAEIHKLYVKFLDTAIENQIRKEPWQ